MRMPAAMARHRARVSQETIFSARKEVNAVHIAEAVETYMVDLVDCHSRAGALRQRAGEVDSGRG